MLDTTFLITVAFLFFGALVSGFVKSRQKDRCLNHFSGYQVTLERTDGDLLWGRMALHPNGIELVYADDVQDEEHVETSYILYKDEFPQIQAVYRYNDEMDKEAFVRRQRDLKHTFHPGPLRRLRRRLRNFLNLMSDSLSEAIGILIGQIQSASSKKLAQGSDVFLSEVGRSVIGYVGTRYDSLLEGYVGTRVVVEVAEQGVIYEHVGILKDYTAEFLEMLDVHYPREAAVPIQPGQSWEDDRLRLVSEGDMLHVDNCGASSLFLQRLRLGDEVKAVNAVLDRDDQLDLHLPEAWIGGQFVLDVKVVRNLDWILPRCYALIRHKAERYNPDQVFDIGHVLKKNRYADEEQRLIELLKECPDDAPSAIALGQILFQRGSLDDAERWYCHALDYRDHLPDGGKLAERQLEYIKHERLRHRRQEG